MERSGMAWPLGSDRFGGNGATWCPWTLMRCPETLMGTQVHTAHPGFQTLGPSSCLAGRGHPRAGWATQEGSKESEECAVQASAGAGLLHHSIDQSRWGASQPTSLHRPTHSTPGRRVCFQVAWSGPRSSGQVTASLAVTPLGLLVPHPTPTVIVTQLLFLTSGPVKPSVSFRSELSRLWAVCGQQCCGEEGRGDRIRWPHSVTKGKPKYHQRSHKPSNSL